MAFHGQQGHGLPARHSTGGPSVQLTELPSSTSPGRHTISVPEAELPDVWEYHQRRSTVSQAMPAMPAMPATPATPATPAMPMPPVSWPARTSLTEPGTQIWQPLNAARVEQASSYHQRPSLQPMGVEEIEHGCGPRERRSLQVIGKNDRLMRLALSCSAFLLALLLLNSSSWQEETMVAKPDEIHRVYSTMMTMIPGGKTTQPKKLSRKVQPVFELRAGLFTAYVVGICKPGAGFDYMVDPVACNRKLEAFCDSLHDSTPNDRWLKLADRLHSSCLSTVQTEQGLRVPLLWGPVRRLWEHEPADGDIGDLEQQFQVAPEDWSSEFCSTVADCEVLESLRPWSFLSLFALIAAVTSLFIAVICDALDAAKSKPDYAKIGFRCTMVSLALFAATACIYLHTAKTYPVSSYIRSESLFYFMLPEPGESTQELARSLAATGADSVAKRWKALLLSLTGALLRGVMEGDMSLFYQQLQETISSAWKVADVLFQRWLKYMRYALAQAPSDGSLILRDITTKLEELDGQLVQLMPNEMNETTEEQTIAKELGEELRKQVVQMLDVNSRATKLVNDGQELVNAILRAWHDIHGPILALIERVRAALHKGARAAEKALILVQDLALDKATVKDLKTIFTRLFDALPKVISGVGKVAEDFNLLTAGVGPLVNQTRRTLHKSSSCLARFAHLEREQAESRALELANGFLKDLSKPEGLKRLSQVWAQFSAEDLSLLFPTAARRLGSADFSIAALVKPLTSSLASPMARISSIFLLQPPAFGLISCRILEEARGFIQWRSSSFAPGRCRLLAPIWASASLASCCCSF
ncbi:unnamed protein product [Effrenium voratum]|uniref:Uncharacterized protein n=1 Tax=Effrenium voratum TaxID=2562239 RepID=A0AA36HKH3_9DINO|nr:unnamed protein product [Effrenium voratum]